MRPIMFVFPVSLAAFGAIWFAFVVPSMMGSEWWSGMTVFGRWLVYNSGIFFIVVGLFGAMVSLLLSHRLSVVQMLINGLAGFLVLSFVLGVYQPPFAISQEGEFVIEQEGTVVEAAEDYMIATAWSALGVSGSALYYMTYIVTPILAMIVAVFLFGLNRFAQLFAEAI